MAGLFALLYGALVGTATVVDNYQVWNENSNQRAEALREGKPYYYGARGTTYMTSTNEQCVRFTNKNGDRCLYSLDLKRELYNFDAANRQEKANEYKAEIDSDRQRVLKLQKIYRKEVDFYPIYDTSFFRHAHTSMYYTDGLTKEQIYALKRDASIFGDGFTNDGKGWIYRESTGLCRYYCIARHENLPKRCKKIYLKQWKKHPNRPYERNFCASVEEMSYEDFIKHADMYNKYIKETKDEN